MQGKVFFLFLICLPWLSIASIDTERLTLRPWTLEDVAIIHGLMQDAETNQYITFYRLDQYEVLKEMATLSNKNIQEKGYGYFVCSLKDTGEVIGIIGLNEGYINAPYFPCPTISYILGKKYWRHGYAKEGTTALLEYGFQEKGMTQIYACTARENESSQKTMKRLGMEFVCTFDHPSIDPNKHHSHYVLYVAKKR